MRFSFDHFALATQQQRVQYLLLGAVVSILALLWGAGLSLYNGFPQLLWLFLPPLLISCAVPVYVSRGGSFLPAAHLLILAALGCVLSISLVTGGRASGTLFWTVFIPALAIVLTGWKAGVFYAVVSFLGLLVIYAMHVYAVPPLVTMSSDHALRDVLLNAPFALVGIAVLTLAYQARLRTTIAELGRTQQRLRTSEERYRRVSELLSDFTAFVALGPGGEPHTDWFSDEEAVRRVLGVEDLGQVRSDFASLVHPDDRTRYRRRLERLGQGDVARDQLRVVRPASGEVRWLDLTAWPEFDEFGTLSGYYSVVRDITGERLQATRLEQTQKMDLLGKLTGSVAHDFNNLLTVIICNLELLESDRSDEEETGELIREAQAAARSGADLITGLLSFSRQRELKPRPVPVGRHLVKNEGLLQRAVGKRGVTLRVVDESEGAVASVDPAQLDSAVLNLCVNARDAMASSGEIELRIRRGPKADGGAGASRAVLIDVTDTGSGMAPDVIERAFEPFFTTKEAGEGTGLGLSMVYAFAQNAGGDVEIDSRLDEGTRVTVSLPAVRTSAPSNPRRRPQDMPRGRERVLVVDDEKSLRLVCGQMLKSLGYVVTTAADASEARRILEGDGEIDLVFTDWVMPGAMDGYELAGWVRSRMPETAVVITTGFAQAATEVGETGEFPVLRKPYTRAELATRIRRTLDERARGPDEPPPQTG